MGLWVRGHSLSVVCTEHQFRVSDFALVAFGGVLEDEPSGNSIVLLGSFYAHVGNKVKQVKAGGVIGRNRLPCLKPSAALLFTFCSCHSLVIINTMYEHTSVQKCTVGPQSVIKFIVKSSGQRPFDPQVKTGAEMSTGHHQW